MQRMLQFRLFFSSAALLILVGASSCSTASGSGSASPPATVAATATAQSQTFSLPTPNAGDSKSTPTATAASTGSGQGAHWSLIYSDDFNGNQPGSTWGTYNGPHGGGHSYYSPGEVSVAGGMLHLRMERKVTNGLPYTTGGIAAFRLAQRYGKYEFRVRLPYGKGVGPYAILWPQTSSPNVETDIFESPPADKSTLYFTNHGGTGGSSSQLRAHGQFAAGFHVLTCEWTPGQLRFLVDGVSQGILTKSIPNQLMWFGIAVESGDAFVGNPDSTTALPVSLDVDWVHIYKYMG